MKNNSGRRKSILFTCRETPAPGQKYASPHVLLPCYDVSKVKLGVLNNIGKTPRLRIPRHMEYIKDLSDANTRFFTKGSGHGPSCVVALDWEVMFMLERAGAVRLKESYRHELMGSPKAS